jgi:hypothetical protein
VLASLALASLAPRFAHTASLARSRRYKAKKKLEREAEENAILEKSLALAAKKLELSEVRIGQEKKLAALELEAGEAREARVKSFKAKLREIDNDSELKMVERRLAVEAKMSDRNMEVKNMDMIKDVYKSLPLQSVNMTNYVGAGAGGGIGVEQILPALTSFTEANQKRAAGK